MGEGENSGGADACQIVLCLGTELTCAWDSRRDLSKPGGKTCSIHGLHSFVYLGNNVLC